MPPSDRPSDAAAGASGPPLPPLDGKPPEDVYRYVDEDGELLFVALRYNLGPDEHGNPRKTFRQAHLDNGRWVLDLDGVRRVPYRLPQVLAHIAANRREPLYIVEGEKDVHAIESQGAVATTNPMGAGKWTDDYSDLLRGARNVVIVADRDPDEKRNAEGLTPGERHALIVQESLGRVGVVATVVAALEGKDAHDHIAAGNGLEDFQPLQGGGLRVQADALTFLSLDAFLELREETVPVLVGTEDETLLSVGGLIVMAGEGGAAKTTLTLDAVAHFASGTPWLGQDVPRPLRICFIENEGSRPKFIRKVQAKLDAWEGKPWRHNVHVYANPWGKFSLAEPEHRALLRGFCRQHQIDLVVADPLDSLGVNGVGSPEDTRAFIDLLKQVGYIDPEHPVAFWLLHHFSKRGEGSIQRQLAGAWDKHPDTIVGVIPDGEYRTKLIWAKARWHSELQGTTQILQWASGFGFEVIDAPAAVTDSTLYARIHAYLSGHVAGRKTEALLNPDARAAGVSKRVIVDNVEGGEARIRTVVDGMLESGLVVVTGKAHGHPLVALASEATPTLETSPSPSALQSEALHADPPETA